MVAIEENAKQIKDILGRILLDSKECICVQNTKGYGGFLLEMAKYVERKVSLKVKECDTVFSFNPSFKELKGLKSFGFDIKKTIFTENDGLIIVFTKN